MKLRESLKKQIRDLSDESRKPFAGLMEDLRHDYKVSSATGNDMLQMLQELAAGAESDTIEGLKTRLVRLDKMREYLLKSELKGQEQKVVYKAYVKVQSAVRARKDQSQKKFEMLSRMTSELGSGILNAAEQAMDEFPLFKLAFMGGKFLFRHAKEASARRKQQLKDRNDSLRKDAELFYKQEILRGRPQKAPGKKRGLERKEGFSPNTFSGEALTGGIRGIGTSINELGQSYSATGGARRFGISGPGKDSSETKVLRVISTDVKKILKYLDWKKIQEKDARLDALESAREGAKLNSLMKSVDKKNRGTNITNPAAPGLLDRALSVLQWLGIPAGGVAGWAGYKWLTKSGSIPNIKEQFDRLRANPPGDIPPAGLDKTPRNPNFGKKYTTIFGYDTPSWMGGRGLGLKMPSINPKLLKMAKFGGKTIPFVNSALSLYQRRMKGESWPRALGGAAVEGVGAEAGGIGTAALVGLLTKNPIAALAAYIPGAIVGGDMAGVGYDDVLDYMSGTPEQRAEIEERYSSSGRALDPNLINPMTGKPYGIGDLADPAGSILPKYTSPMTPLRGYANKRGPEILDWFGIPKDGTITGAVKKSKIEELNKIRELVGLPQLKVPEERDYEFISSETGKPVESAGSEGMLPDINVPGTSFNTDLNTIRPEQSKKIVDSLQQLQKADPGNILSMLLPVGKIMGNRGIKELVAPGSKQMGILFPINTSSGAFSSTGSFWQNMIGGIGRFFTGTGGRPGGVPGGVPGGLPGGTHGGDHILGPGSGAGVQGGVPEAQYDITGGKKITADKLGRGFRVRDGLGSGKTHFGHTGQDVPVPEGTPISIVPPGTVVDVKASNGPHGYGNSVVVKLDDGRYIKSNHHKRNLVKVGDRVGMQPDGSVKAIAEAGETGLSTGPHMHIDLGTGYSGGKITGLMNPRDFILGGGVVTGGNAKASPTGPPPASPGQSGAPPLNPAPAGPVPPSDGHKHVHNSSPEKRQPKNEGKQQPILQQALYDFQSGSGGSESDFGADQPRPYSASKATEA